MLPDDGMNGREAQARAFADFFGRVKRIENAVQYLRGHAATLVRNAETHKSTGARVQVLLLDALTELHQPCGNPHATAPGHGISGIEREVHDDLFEIPFIGAGLRQVILTFQFQLALFAEQLGQRRLHSSNGF